MGAVVLGVGGRVGSGWGRRGGGRKEVGWRGVVVEKEIESWGRGGERNVGGVSGVLLIYFLFFIFWDKGGNEKDMFETEGVRC